MSAPEQRPIESHGRMSIDHEGIIIDPRALDALQQRAAEQEQRIYNRRQIQFNGWLMAFTGLLVVVTLISDFILFQQLQIAQKSATDAHTAAEAAKASADAAKDGVTQNKTALTATLHQSAVALDKTLRQNQDDLTATLAKQDQVLRTTAFFNLIDQQPWVTAATFTLGGKLEVGMPTWITIWLQNGGKTPALNILSTSEILFSENEPPWPNSISTNQPSRFIIPGQSNGNTYSSNTVRIYPSEQEISEYKSGKLRLYVHAFVRYTDIYKQTRGANGCAYHVFSQPASEFTFCSDPISNSVF